ncbi:hypothetical protein THAOC_16959 [Thalassiosira oceanica]|uniref:Uncharacterized protein n=1 Tax=Thalassiosira oceanica TaxID=159749 RepID=K0SAV4_THAOC|nr:hypothetical protein THAOC_16959 [Thalassiosira oceanica]|eukprot:EJK62430.1 hypothetical protein THAOC_16959 [Thalassiosira oceanica]
MKLIISSAFAAALVSSASANCVDIGNSAAGEVMMANGCFPTALPNTSGASCNDTPYAIEVCKIFIDREFTTWCSNVSVNKRRLKNQCANYVLQSEESGAEEEVVFSEDSGDNEDEDAPVPAVDTYPGLGKSKANFGVGCSSAGIWNERTIQAELVRAPMPVDSTMEEFLLMQIPSR